MPESKELSIRAVAIAVLATVILTAANIYLGMRAGITISASIPAAVFAIGVLRLFKQHSILEVNIIQTAASTGEALAAGMMFSVPALVILGYWFHFPYWQTVFIGLVGGLLGVIFSVPIRRVLLEQNLPFPEGTAIGNVLLTQEENARGLKLLINGGIISATLSFLQNGIKIFVEQFQLWFKFGNTIFGFAVGFNPALIGAGFIIGPQVCFSILLGVIFGWVLGIPLLSSLHVEHTINVNEQVYSIYSNHLRFIGLGVFLVGGLLSLKPLLKPIYRSVLSAIRMMRQQEIPIYRKSEDLPFSMVMLTCVGLSGLLWLIIQSVMNYQSSHLSMTYLMLLSITLVFVILFLGFILAAICGYLVGLVGSSSSPISALSTIGLLICASVIYLFIKIQFPEPLFSHYATFGAAFAILTTAFITSASAITNDTIQDYKAGQMIGASPLKQQIMMMIGVVIAALIIPVIFNLLLDAYGMNPNDPNSTLAVPQAQLMATISESVFSFNLNWQEILFGVGVALVLQAITVLSSISITPLAVGLGMYLPLSSSTALFIGGLVHHYVKNYLQQSVKIQENFPISVKEKRGILFASGIVAGSSIMGIVLAVPHALSMGLYLGLLRDDYYVVSVLLSLLATLTLCGWFYHIVCRTKTAH